MDTTSDNHTARDVDESDEDLHLHRLSGHAESRAVDAAVQKGLALVQQFGDNRNDPAWENPDIIYQQLDQARSELSLAWSKLHDAVRTTSVTEEPDQEHWRTAYMDMITDAFADVLENLRQRDSKDPLDVELLVDCLQSGLDLWQMNSSLPLGASESDFLWNDDDDVENTMEEDVFTPHELRRRELGYHVGESTA